jgi:hypothetical protein
MWSEHCTIWIQYASDLEGTILIMFAGAMLSGGDTSNSTYSAGNRYLKSGRLRKGVIIVLPGNGIAVTSGFPWATNKDVRRRRSISLLQVPYQIYIAGHGSRLATIPVSCGSDFVSWYYFWK